VCRSSVLLASGLAARAVSDIDPTAVGAVSATLAPE
jgi:hypothetical protein